MDAAAFEQVYGSFRDFHAYFAPLFGRRETREHSGHYLQALLVQSGERRNAENLSETVPGSARGMQRFLTDSPWDDEVIIGRLQEYLGTRLPGCCFSFSSPVTRPMTKNSKAPLAEPNCFPSLAAMRFVSAYSTSLSVVQRRLSASAAPVAACSSRILAETLGCLSSLNQSQGGNYILQRWQRHGRCKHQCVGSGL